MKNEKYALKGLTAEHIRRYKRLIDVGSLDNAWVDEHGSASYITRSVVMPESTEPGMWERKVVPVLVIKKPAVEYVVGELYNIGNGTWKVLAADNKRVLAVCTNRETEMYYPNGDSFKKAVKNCLRKHEVYFLSDNI